MNRIIIALTLAAVTTAASASWWHVIFQPSCGATICVKFDRK